MDSMEIAYVLAPLSALVGAGSEQSRVMKRLDGQTTSGLLG